MDIYVDNNYSHSVRSLIDNAGYTTCRSNPISGTFIVLKSNIDIESLKRLCNEDGLTVYQQDGYTFVYNDAIIVQDDYGSSGIERDWRKDVKKHALSLKLEFPISLEINSASLNMNSKVPTIRIINYELLHYYVGTHTLSKKIMPIVFNDYENLIMFNNCYDSWAKVKLYSTTWVPLTLPFCSVVKNEYGIGNTIILNQIKYSPEKSMGIMTIEEALLTRSFWNKVLIPLLTADVGELREYFDNQILPVTIRARMFKIKQQEYLMKELEDILEKEERCRLSIEENIQTITRLKQSLTTFDKEKQAKKAQIRAALHSNSLYKQVQKLLELPYVKDVDFDEACIIIYTNPIQVDDGPFLGGYKIEHYPIDSAIVITNLENPDIEHDLAHPHIPQGGNPCFGNYTDIYYHFNTGEYVAGMEFLHSFLSTYDPEDEWGRRLIYWAPEYVFEDMRERDILYKVEENIYGSIYYNIYGESLCGEEICPNCQLPIEDCDCLICTYCGGTVGVDCECERCENCGELIEDCDCSRCEVCNELLDNILSEL